MASKPQKIEPKRIAAIDPDIDSSERVAEVAIAARAYELWEQRGCPIGSPEVDWFRAEEELTNSHAAAAD